jgi:hypothetical protein
MSSDFLLLAMPVIAVGAVAATGAAIVFDVVRRHPKRTIRRANRKARAEHLSDDVRVEDAGRALESVRGSPASRLFADLISRLSALDEVVPAGTSQDGLPLPTARTIAAYGNLDIAMEKVLQSVDPQQTPADEVLKNQRRLMEKARQAHVDIDFPKAAPARS